MRTVEDESGRRYLLLTESAESSRVRDVETGEERYLANDRLTRVAGESPLSTAARAIPGPLRRLVVAVPDERALGLLVELHDRGPLSPRDLLARYDLCASDLHGLLAELRTAGLVERADTSDGPGYTLTGSGERAIARLQSDVTR